MATPLVIVCLLVIPLILSHLYGRFWDRDFNSRLGGTIGLSLAFTFFGIGHFVRTEAMVEMLPLWLPLRVPLIYLTGILEWSLALGLLMPSLRRLVGWLCIGCLVLFLPANIYAAMNSIGMGGHTMGPIYLLIRIPLQALLIGWAYQYAIRKE